MNTRIKYLDALKFFTIFLVVWGHSIQHFQTNDYSNNIVFRYIYSFHMGLFMMISGYFSVSSMKMSTMPFISKKFMRLIYPCLVWGGIVWAIQEITNYLVYGIDNISFTELLSNYYWMSDFWFLKACFICYCLTYLGVHSTLRKKYWVLLTLLTSQLIPLFQVPYMYPCFLIGWLMKNSKELTDWIFSNTHLFIVTFIFMLIFWSHNAWYKSHYFPSIHNTDFINYTSLLVECLFFRIYRLIIGVIGSIASISVFRYIFKTNIPNSKYLDVCCQMGKYTLEVYLIHSILFVRFLKFIINFDNIEFKYYTFIITPICSIFILVLCVSIAKLTHHSPFISRYLWGT